MRTRSLTVALAAVASLSLAATACAPTNEEGEEGDERSILSVGWNQPFYSYNSNTSNGNATANANILYLTTSGFNYYDADANLQKDETFGTYEQTSEDPLTVEYTVGDDTHWSDGTEVDAVDLLLYWAATSGQFNTIDPTTVERDETTGAPTNTKGEVFWDAAAYVPEQGLALVTQFPEISEDGKTVTFVYDKPWADWEVDFTNAGTILPAHVVVEKALGTADPQEAKDELVTALQEKDNAKLEKIANFWNSGFDFTSMPEDEDLVLSSGAYIIKDLKENEYVTLERNPEYSGMREPKIDELTVRWNEDPTAQLQALENGEISMMAPQVTEDVVNAARDIEGVEVETGVEGTYEHVDLVMNNGGPFDPATYGGDANTAKLVRQAFLHAYPRQEIVDKLIKPIQPDAVVRNSFLIDVGAPGYDEIIQVNGSSEYAERDPERARQLLQQAGVQTPIRVRMMYAEGNVRRENEFAIAKPALQEVGFNLIDAKSPDWGAKLGDGTYDAVFFGWQSTSTAVTGNTATFHSSGGNNLVGYKSPVVDRLFDELAFTTDEEEQFEILTKIDQELFKDAIGITLFQFPSATIYDSRDVSGVNTAFLAPTMFYEFWNWETQ